MATAGREFFTARTVADALREFRPGHRSTIETVRLDSAWGRVPAADIAAHEALPGFDRSSVDGYAVRASDTFGASEAIPAYLRVTAAVRMGEDADAQVTADAAVAVPTGGMLPPGADAVVMVEHTQEAMPGTIEVVRPVAPGEGVVRRDEDAAPGARLVSAGRPLRAQDLALLAAAGVSAVDVHAAPRVTIIPTGDEICPAGEAELPPGHVRDALTVSIGALAREAGGDPHGTAIVSDDPGALQDALELAVRDSDVIVICAGSSVGARDQTAAAVAALDHAEIWCHGLAIKPGKPTLLALIDGIPVIGLPGNPRSALVVFRLIGMPVVRRVGGWTVELHPASVRARLSRDLASAAGRLDVVQVRLHEGEAEPLFGPSALLSVLTAADGYMVVAQDATGLAAGAEVEVFLYV
ncbi:MAG: molybdopterin molybdotransferase MoeA [Solirubrobacterales bacterium]|nr:molybdopterin molybdotransferase MoeA [Solirubrobacterales bacterium]